MHQSGKIADYKPCVCWCTVCAYFLRLIVGLLVRACFLLAPGITSPFSQISEALLLTGRPPPPLRLSEGSLRPAVGCLSGSQTRDLDVSLVYFDVRKADIFMLGVLLFFIWADGAVWAVSDPKQDQQ